MKMAVGNNIHHLAVSLTLFGSALSQIVNGPDYDSPTGGPPASYFAADSSIPVSALLNAVSGLKDNLDSYPYSQGSSAQSVIYGDWAKFADGAAIVWTADMDVDCDGLDYECRGNPDGLPQTNWGALAAYEVPFIVIPDEYLSAHEDTLPGNNLAAVICNGKMYYGILGDSNGDEPQVTGEASWLMARTCFPDDDLNGNKGHDQNDVTYILFLGDEAVLPSSAVDENYISNFGTLKSLGNGLMNALVANLGLGGSTPPSQTASTTTATSTTTAPTATATGGGCSWVGHCEGSSCSTSDDCSDDLVCSGGVCSVDGSDSGCSWEGHCEGASCSSDDDCSDDLYCDDGKCTSGIAAPAPGNACRAL